MTSSLAPTEDRKQDFENAGTRLTDFKHIKDERNSLVDVHKRSIDCFSLYMV